jgi:hypothetical protein
VKIVYQAHLRPNYIANRYDGKLDAVGFARSGVDTAWTSAPITPTENIGADDEIAVCVKGFTWSNH